MKFRNNTARLTMFIFGFLAFVLGILGLKDHKTLLKQMGFTAVLKECAPRKFITVPLWQLTRALAHCQK